ncbi:MAG: hypothetical protein ACI8WB_001973 [Phenylobacterium sp.]|jgi:hypothetical protein
MKTTMRIILPVLLGTFTVGSANAATCSCAGVPLLNSITTSSPQSENWYFSTTYEYHKISDLYSGSDEVNDETHRDRVSQSTLFELGYGINENWSVATLLSATKHQRAIGNNSEVDASGVGDGVVLFKYTGPRISVYSRWQYALGAGVKVPLGEDSAQHNGIDLAEDMQPSSGAYSGLLWGYLAHSFSAQANWQVYSSINYASNGENDRDYTFGNELNLAVGATYQDDSPWGYQAAVRYRTTSADQRAGVDIPNTGGYWVTFLPTLAYSFDETWSLSTSARIPLYRNLDGELQFTTSWAASMTLNYVF